MTPNDAAQSEVKALHKLRPPGPESSFDVIGYIQSLFSANDPHAEEFAKDLGFASAKEAADAEIGLPMRVCSVSLDRLQVFRKGDDPNDLLVDTHRLLFPLMVKGQARSSLTVMEDKESGKGWQVVQKGAPTTIQKIQQQQPTNSTFLILISALGLRFLGDRKDQKLVLTAIDENSRLNVRPGDQRSAAELFDEMSPYAEKVYDSHQQMQQKYPKDRKNKTSITGGEKC